MAPFRRFGFPSGNRSLLQDFLIECRSHGSINYGKMSSSWSCNAPQTITLPPPCLTVVWCSFYEIPCWFCARCRGTHIFQKVQLLSHQTTEYLPKSLGDNQDIFLAKLRRAFVFFLVSNGFCLGTLQWMQFLPSLFLIVESWTLTLIEASEACISLDVVLGSFMTSWMSRHCALGIILVGRPHLGRFTTVHQAFSICG